MNVHRSLWLALPIAFLLPLGCNNAAGTGQETDPSVAATAQAEAPAAAPQGHHHRRHGGLASMMFHAAHKLDLTGTQRSTIDGLATQMRGGDHAAEASSRHAMRAALVQGVRAGNVDLAALQPMEASAATARQARAERRATALNGLWAALQPAQRTALVASVREHQAKRAAHWANHEGEHTPGSFAQKRLAHLTTQLGLDAAQQTAVGNLLAKGESATPAAREARHAQMKAHREAFLSAFQGDAFDASKLQLSSGREGIGQSRRAEFLAQLVPILRADQRETLASSMEKEHHGKARD